MHVRTRVSLFVVLLLIIAACSPVGTDGGDSEDTAAETGGTEGDTATTAGGGGGTQQLTVATGGTGGVYFPLGGGLAQVIRENVDGYDATAQETNASVDNMLLIESGGADIAFTLADTAADAVNGEGEFQQAISACTLGRIYNNFTQVVTSSDSGITSVADLEGTQVSLGSPGSGTEVIGLRILEAAGLDPDADIDRQQLGVDETVAALRDGNIDAGFWSGGLPTGALVDYATTGDMVLVPTAEYAEDLANEYGPFYISEEIPADTYQGLEESVATIVVPNVLAVSTEMPEELQTQITQATFDNKESLVQVHPAAEELDPETAADVEFMEVCPGAAAYYEGS